MAVTDTLPDAALFPAVRRTPLPGGYMGKLLRVDLSAGRPRMLLSDPPAWFRQACCGILSP